MEKITRTPKNAESILKGALKLSLSDQVALIKELRRSVDEKIQAANIAAEEARKTAEDTKQMINGL